MNLNRQNCLLTDGTGCLRLRLPHPIRSSVSIENYRERKREPLRDTPAPIPTGNTIRDGRTCSCYKVVQTWIFRDFYKLHTGNV